MTAVVRYADERSFCTVCKAKIGLFADGSGSGQYLLAEAQAWRYQRGNGPTTVTTRICLKCFEALRAVAPGGAR